MKTLNFQYTSKDELLIFVSDHEILDNEKLLIQIFSGICEFEIINELRFVFKDLFPLSSLIGATNDGSIINGELAKDGEIIVVFTQFEKTTLSLGYNDLVDDSFYSGQEIAKNIYIPSKTKAIISFTDGIIANGEEYLNGIHSICPEVSVSGGMAGDNGLIKQTFIFTKDNITDKGAIAVALNNPELRIKTSYNFNWTPIGKRMWITRSIKDRVYEIDGMPAVDVYSKYLGKELAKQLPLIGIEFPFVIQINGMNIGRAVLDKYSDGSLKFAGNIAEQSEIRFGVGNLEMILKDSKSYAQHLTKDVESIFIYSCMARRRFLGGSLSHELKALKNISNVSGFFTYGEFYTNECSEKYLLNESMTVLAISEGIECQQSMVSKADDSNEEEPNDINALLVLSHLANTVSEELEQLNIHLEERVEENTNIILQQIYTDRLTQLPNRIKFINDIKRNDQNTMVLINVDKFSMINDFYGHKAGDEVLQQLARNLRAAIEDDNIALYRLSSDEFVILYPYIFTPKSLDLLVKTGLPKLDPLIFKYENEDIHISVTVAVADCLEIKSDLLAHANMALQYARKKNLRYALYHDDMLMSEQYKSNISMSKKVRSAIVDERIVPFYQPIIELSSGKIVKYECLARLIERNGNVISPYEFIPIASKIRLYSKITRLIIFHSFKRFSQTNISFSINLSIEDILDNETQDFIFSMIENYNVSSQLTFEILETQELENDTKIIDFIEKVQAMNGAIAIDDFGSGFANFERMTRIKANYIKIDGSLIKNIHTDQNARIVVETIITFAKKLNMEVVAEFVHSEAVLKVIQELGISHAQGFHLGMPSPEIVSKE